MINRELVGVVVTPDSWSRKYGFFPKKLFLLFLLAGFIGLLDSAYLTIEHYRGGALTCSLVSGCQKVVTSSYSTIAGIPVSLLGVFYYLSILLLVIVLREVWSRFPPSGWRRLLTRLIPVITTIGFLFTLYLLYLMFFVIKAICIYCLGSALSSTLLLFLGIYLLKGKGDLHTSYVSDSEIDSRQ